MKQIGLLFLLFDISVGMDYLQRNLHMHFGTNEVSYELISCIKIVVKKLFDDEERVNIISPDGAVNLYQEVEILKELEEHISIKFFRVYNDTVRYKNPLEKILSAFLVFSIDPDQFQRDFNGDFFKDSSKFIIITNETMDSIQNFSDRLIQYGFKTIAFLNIDFDIPYPEHKYNLTSNIANCQRVLKNPESIKFLKPNYPPLLQFIKIINDNFVANNDDEDRKKNKNATFITRLLASVAEKYSMKLLQRNEGWKWNVALDLLKRNMVNIIYAPDQQNILLYIDKLAICGPATFDSVFVVDRMKEASMEYFTFAVIFTKRVWYCTISAFIAITLVSLCLNKFQTGGTKQEYLYFRYIFMMTFSQGIPKVPTKSNFRIAMGVWIFCVYIMTIVFNDTYRSTLIGLPRVKLLKTFEDIIESGRVVYGSEYYVNLLRNSTDQRMSDFGHRCQIAPSQLTLDKILHSDALGILKRSDVLAHNYINRAIASRQLYFLTHTEIFVSFSLLFTKRYDYFNNAYGKLLRLDTATAIANKIRIDYNKEKYGTRNVQPMKITIQGASIQLVHLMRIVKYIYLGYVIATIAIILEIIVHRVKG